MYVNISFKTSDHHSLQYLKFNHQKINNELFMMIMNANSKLAPKCRLVMTDERHVKAIFSRTQHCWWSQHTVQAMQLTLTNFQLFFIFITHNSSKMSWKFILNWNKTEREKDIVHLGWTWEICTAWLKIFLKMWQ